MSFPSNLKYSKDYSWVSIKSGVATVGVIEPAAKRVKEFVFIKLPKKELIKEGDTYVSLEAVKWSGHLKSPVTGEVIEVNDSLFDEPSVINKDSYVSWIMKVKLSSDPKDLMDSKGASTFYAKELGDNNE